MKYEFELIESLINSAFGDRTKSKKSFEEQFAEVRNAVATERDRIRKTFAHQFWGLENDQQRENYLQYHVQGLIFLIDDLFERSQATKNREGKQSRLADEAFFVYDLLEEVLFYLRDNFHDYWNPDTKLPEPHRRKVSNQLKERFRPVQEFISTHQSAALSICTQGIIICLDELRFTHRKEQYLGRLIDSIVGLISQNPEVSELDIRSCLLSLNFNVEGLFKLFVESMQKELADADSDGARLERLAYRLKWINQIPEYPGLSFNSSFRPLKLLLGEWVLEEQQFLEKKKELVIISQVSEKEFISKGFKLEFDMSVSQFAYFIKTFIETGVVQNKNISELIRFLARFVKTKRSENIAFESFRMKYYNVEGSTKDAVKNILHTAIGYINSN